MRVEVKVIVTGHYEDKPMESMVMVFGNEETDAEILKAMAESYYLDEDDEGKKVELPNDMTWEWLENQIGSYAWWTIDQFDIEVPDLVAMG